MVRLLIAISFCSIASASPRLKGIACRSVHLAWRAAECDAIYNEVVVRKSASGTYFCVLGFSRGYFGIQELANGKKIVLFSVWDPGKQNNPNVVPADRRTRVLFQAKDVRVKRFGNEGTGGQSFFDLPWKVGDVYRFAVRASADPKDEKRTAFSAYLFLPQSKKWKHLVTFSTLANKARIKGAYSFVEDFRRNRISATKTRTAEFGPVWTRGKNGKWSPAKTARFTADGNPVTNIDAGIVKSRCFLSTGGEIKNSNIPLWKSMTIPAAKTLPPPLAAWKP